MWRLCNPPGYHSLSIHWTSLHYLREVICSTSMLLYRRSSEATNKVSVAVAEWVARQTAEQEVGGSNPSIPAETRMWGRRLAAMLAVYTSRGVAPEVNLRERISCMPPQSLNKAEPTLALKPRGDVTRSPKQGYQWPHKWTCVQQNFFLKKKNK